MPMIYVTDETEKLIDTIVATLKKGVNNMPSRIVKADVVHVAVSEYAKKLGMK